MKYLKYLILTSQLLFANVNTLQQDIEKITQCFQEMHPGRDDPALIVRFEKNLETAQKRINEAKTNEDALLILQDLVSIGHGHFYLELKPYASYRGLVRLFVQESSIYIKSKYNEDVCKQLDSAFNREAFLYCYDKEKLHNCNLPSPLKFLIRKFMRDAGVINTGFLDKDAQVPVIAVKSFMPFYQEEFENFAKQHNFHRYEKIVVDLRGNTGGSLHNVYEIAECLFYFPPYNTFLYNILNNIINYIEGKNIELSKGVEQCLPLLREIVDFLRPGLYPKQIQKFSNATLDIHNLINLLKQATSANELFIEETASHDELLRLYEKKQNDEDFIKMIEGSLGIKNNTEAYILVDERTVSASFEFIRTANGLCKKVVIIGDDQIIEDKYTSIAPADAISLGDNGQFRLFYPTKALPDPLTVTPDHAMPKTKAELLELVMRN